MSDPFQTQMDNVMPRLQRTMAFFPQITVGTAPVKVIADPMKQRRRLVVQNTGTVDVRVGGADVTATTGMKLVPGQVQVFDFSAIQNEVYVAAATAGAVDGYETC